MSAAADSTHDVDLSQPCDTLDSSQVPEPSCTTNEKKQDNSPETRRERLAHVAAGHDPFGRKVKFARITEGEWVNFHICMPTVIAMGKQRKMMCKHCGMAAIAGVFR
eukprot:TRINITY_DN5362_c0_g2_i6.p1 TRINITY_DN5362_c0_g2~~TRINITY_DN5362_c0_g2_i6.p1  ORF type:complete len:107 (+),score=7.48 TRINITY_DN5362_c0_g2_i6:651-971(+)